MESVILRHSLYPFTNNGEPAFYYIGNHSRGSGSIPTCPRTYTLDKTIAPENMKFQKSLNFHFCRIAGPAGSVEFPVFCRYGYHVKTWEPGAFGDI